MTGTATSPIPAVVGVLAGFGLFHVALDAARLLVAVFGRTG